MDVLKIEKFLSPLSTGKGTGNGYGSGYSNGCCCYDGSGYGDGKGYSNGYGNSDGDGYGDGYNYSNGYGDGNGYGNGKGRGNGYGNSYGIGYGVGSSRGIKNINGYNVYNVDNISTIFIHIRGNVAKGYILESNVILKPCFIVKGNGYFAHGETLREAQSALEEKILDDIDVEEKIEFFKEKFPDVNKKYPVKDFYQWHHILTGSCEMGRKSFAKKNHNIDIDNDLMTVKEFINLTENAYGGDIIRKLKGVY